METVAERYDLLEVLGRGGMGVVHRGHDRMLDREVAVKVLPAQHASDASLVQRFEREARAAARLNHPNIVAVYDTGRDGTLHYIVMECVAGSSLAQLLNERGALPPAQAVDIAAQVADALGAAHHAGLVHRDVKPANVMVEPSGGCKVLDFGIARAAAEAALTQTASVLGSAPYMAPETARGEPADARSDIYSLGCVLYEMLTDEPPFRGELPAAIMTQHLHNAPRPPSELRSGIPPALDGVVMRMLAKEPGERPQDAAQTATALRAALHGHPTAATAPLLPASGPPTAAEPATARQTRRPIGPPPPLPGEGRFPARWLALLLVLAVLVAAGIALALSSGSGSNGSTTSTTSSSTPSSTTHSTAPSTAARSTSSSTPRTSTTTSTVTSSPTSRTTSSSTTSSHSSTGRSTSP